MDRLTEDLGEEYITCSEDGQLTAWHSVTDQAVRQFRGGSRVTSAHAVSMVYPLSHPSGFLATASCNSPHIQLWSWQSEQFQLRFSIPEIAECLSFSSDGALAAVGTASGYLFVWDARTGTMFMRQHAHFRSIRVLKWTVDSFYMISAGADGRILIWKTSDILSASYQSSQTRSVRPFVAFSDHALPIMDIYMGMGKSYGRMVSVSMDQTCRFWDLATMKLLATIQLPDSLHCVVMDAREATIFTGSSSGSIFCIDLVQTELIDRGVTIHSRPSSFIGHQGTVRSVAVCNEGHLLVSASEDATIRIWDVVSRQQLRSHSLQNGFPVFVQFCTLPVLESRGVVSDATKPAMYPLRPFVKAFQATMESVEDVVQARLSSLSSPEERMLDGLPVTLLKNARTNLEDWEEEDSDPMVWDLPFVQSAANGSTAESAPTDSTIESQRWKSVALELYATLLDKLGRTT